MVRVTNLSPPLYYSLAVDLFPRGELVKEEKLRTKNDKRSRWGKQNRLRLNCLEGRHEKNHINWFDDILSMESSAKQKKELIN